MYIYTTITQSSTYIVKKQIISFLLIIETDKTYNTHVSMNIHILIEKPFLNCVIEIKLLCKM